MPANRALTLARLTEAIELPLSSAERARNCMARKRLLSRKSGLCYTCCKQRPKPGRVVCVSCITAVAERKRRKRERDRDAVEVRGIINGHERAGDQAHKHRLYDDAAQHYRDALSLDGVTSEDHLRISEKLAYALSLGRDPLAASPLFDHALATFLDRPAQAAKTVEILLQRARQLWIDSRTEAAIPLIAQAKEVAEADNNLSLRAITNHRMVNYLIGLSRYEEARSIINETAKYYDGYDAITQATYCAHQGALAAAFGEATDAFAYFERAITIVKEDADVYHLTSLWGMYAGWAQTLGNIALAKGCLERALLMARQYHIVWRTVDLCLFYAECLFHAGQYGAAHEYLLEALSYDPQSPGTQQLLAAVGIPIALHMNDERTIDKCTCLPAVDYAFRSGEPDRIASTAVAFARWHSALGRNREAHSLLHRVVKSVKRIERVWELPIAVARYGVPSDVPRVRKLLEARIALSGSEFGQACLMLVDAFAAQRKGLLHESRLHAQCAVDRFTALGWWLYADVACTLLPTADNALRLATTHRPFPDLLSTLTAREQEVAELVIRGHTNRAIAEALSIAERTVEAHMTSIMHHLGIRSRHQLGDQLANN